MGAECRVCGYDIYDECGHCKVVDERDRLRGEADKWHQQAVNAWNRLDRLLVAAGCPADEFETTDEAVALAVARFSERGSNA